ncbi:hypothetical protein M9Y10_034172 [Tritrichomonas musculus]|uniref:Uncharacterized protein n=1 Tax=Tritrichomonas musculus TaxID=1915356 RepID=A0ABR2KEX4_9EUKA
MFIFIFFNLSISLGEYLFSYSPINLKTDSFNFPVPNFPSSWNRFDGLSFTNKSNKTVIVPTSQSTKTCPYVTKTIKQTSDKYYNYVKVSCNGEDTGNTVAFCYVDITRWKTSEYPTLIYKYGANSKLGKTTIYQLNELAPNISLSVTAYLVNEDKEKEAHFNVPTIEFFNYVEESYPLEIEKTKINSNSDRITATIKYNTTEPRMNLHTLEVFDAFPCPKEVEDASQSYVGSSKKLHGYPIIANKTHTIGVDVFNKDVIHLWSIESKSIYEKSIVDNTSIIKKFHSFNMELEVRDKNGFKMSFILLKQESNSWLDALEKWHLNFPEIYEKQPGGVGLWAPFAQLKSLFPNTTEDRDVYGANFIWGADVYQVKPYLSSYIYTEPGVGHIPIEFNEESYWEDIKKCALNESHPSTRACQEAYEDVAFNSDSVPNIRAENASWNVGMISFNMLKGKTLQTKLKQLNSTINAYLRNNVTIHGIGLDSFNAAFYVDYLTKDRSCDYDLPYYLVDGDKRFVPNLANFFNIYKMYDVLSIGGFMTNSVYEPPQLTQFHGSSGYEIKLVDTVNDALEYTKYYQRNFFRQRYVVGSRPLSYIENTDREISLKYKESYFSIMLSFGAWPSYFSYNAASSNFWAKENKDELESLKPFFKRWIPIFNTVLNGTIYYANQRGMVEFDIPQNNQIPEIDNKTENDIFSKSLFCNKLNCYLVIFTGYRGNYQKNDLKRTINAEIKEANNLECIFAAKNTDCYINKNIVTVKMEGMNKGDVFRSAVVKFQITQKQKNNKKNVTLIVLVVLSVLIVISAGIVIFYFCYIKKKRDGSINGQSHTSLL